MRVTNGYPAHQMAALPPDQTAPVSGPARRNRGRLESLLRLSVRLTLALAEADRPAGRSSSLLRQLVAATLAIAEWPQVGA